MQNWLKNSKKALKLQEKRFFWSCSHKLLAGRPTTAWNGRKTVLHRFPPKRLFSTQGCHRHKTWEAWNQGKSAQGASKMADYQVLENSSEGAAGFEAVTAVLKAVFEVVSYVVSAVLEAKKLSQVRVVWSTANPDPSVQVQFVGWQAPSSCLKSFMK